MEELKVTQPKEEGIEGTQVGSKDLKEADDGVNAAQRGLVKIPLGNS
jgi:hypothetical protein